MNKSAQPNRKTGRMVTKNLIVLFTLAVVCFVGIYSWFTNNATATAKGIGVRCEAPDGVEIAAVEHGQKPIDSDFKTTFELDESGFLAKLSMKEITSDGVNFYSPKLTQTNGKAQPDESQDWSHSEAGVDYLCFDLYMRTKNPRSIYLSSNTNVETVDSVLTWTGNNTLCDNPSTYGAFSRDCMVGATRFSINSSENVSKLKWITRPDIYLQQNDSDYSVLTNLTTNEYKTYEHNYWNVNYIDGVQTKTLIHNADGFVANGKQLGEKQEITTADDFGDEATLDKDYKYSYVVVNLWVEGEDAEARLALSGGKFKLNLFLEGNL